MWIFVVCSIIDECPKGGIAEEDTKRSDWPQRFTFDRSLTRILSYIESNRRARFDEGIRVVPKIAGCVSPAMSTLGTSKIATADEWPVIGTRALVLITYDNRQRKDTRCFFFLHSSSTSQIEYKTDKKEKKIGRLMLVEGEEHEINRGNNCTCFGRMR